MLIGCGSSSHAALLGQNAIEALGEARLRGRSRERVPLSRSGARRRHPGRRGLPVRRDVDTLQALREARRGRARTVAVSNIVDASMAREADAVLYTRAGLEIGVASTKTALAQSRPRAPRAAASQVRSTISDLELADAFHGLAALPELVAEVLKGATTSTTSRRAARRARLLLHRSTRRLPGRARRGPQAEGAELPARRGYPAGELKHGPIALIEPAPSSSRSSPTGLARQAADEHRGGQIARRERRDPAPRRRRGGGLARRLVLAVPDAEPLTARSSRSSRSSCSPTTSRGSATSTSTGPATSRRP